MDATTHRPTKHMTFLCTRFNLASELISRGYVAERIQNPFRLETSAWLFRLTPAVAEIVRAYYLNIGKPAPRVIREYFEADSLSSESDKESL